MMNSGSSAAALPPIHSYHPQHNNNSTSSSLSSSAQPRSPPPLLPAVTPNTGPRNTKARACTNCKTKKIACRPGTVSGVCVKCQRDNKKCIVEEPTPRPVRGKGTSKARVAEMEKKLDGLVALLTGAQSVSSNNNNNSSPNLSDQEQAAIGLANLAPSLSRLYHNGDKGAIASLVNENTMPDFNVGSCLSVIKAKDDEFEHRRKERRERDEEIERQQEKVRQDVNCSNFNFIMPPPSIKVPLEDVIGRNLVTEAQADQYFSLFTEMSAHFPFYVIPPGTTPTTLRREKPMLLMAILCTASGIDKRVQIVLDRDFRKAYSERIFVNGEKSLELLQAGLLYLSWFQCHFSPRTQIFLQMAHLFISLVTDLGYDRKPDKVKPPTGVLGNEGNVASPMFSEAGSEPAESTAKLEEQEFRNKETRRAFLGCWWLTSSLSIDFRKRIPLHFSNYMARCQQSFVESPEFESDKYMVMMLRLQKFQEDVCETFRYHEPEIAGKQDLLRIQMSLKAFQTQLKILEQDFQFLDPRNPTFDSVYPSIFVMGIYLHEIGLHMTPPPASTASYAPTASLEYTAERIGILSECLSYTKKYLDCLTSCEPSCYRRMTAPCWMRISYALVVLSKLALGGTEPVDLCSIKEKTVIQYSSKQYTTLNPHPAMIAEAAQKKKREFMRRMYNPNGGVPSRSPTPEPEPRPGIALIPSPSNVDGWDTSVVRAAVKMEIYLDRMVEICKILHRPSLPIRDEDRERYKANGVEEIVPPDLYDFGMWMFGTMKEWYLAMVRREEEIEEAVKDAVSATPGSLVGSGITIAGSTGGSIITTTTSGTPNGSIITTAATGSSARTRSTSISATTPGGGTPLAKGWTSPTTAFQSLKRKFDSDKPRGPNNGAMGDYASPIITSGAGGGGGGQGIQPMQPIMGGPDDQQMALPPSIGFDFMDPVGDDFWGAMWSNWPLFYPGA
ncbi:hypothetical protein TWF970_007057 [Orbilia oligospora]|uniref:Zn(2)-C6 fungal-type domain-containing protein n=1 Tax=Orbilia oligospora TaxID=2813651 RepID=A0A7C8VMH7_ORBOL|nr:hypothetical protein TWF970_007057 [Orbilia oligospora]